jgi:hypothetical protein
MLRTDQPKPDIGRQSGTVEADPDGSTDVYIGPTPPDGKTNNWLQTVPGKAFLRMDLSAEPVVPVAFALIGTDLRPSTVAFMGRFGPLRTWRDAVRSRAVHAPDPGARVRPGVGAIRLLGQGSVFLSRIVTSGGR